MVEDREENQVRRANRKTARGFIFQIDSMIAAHCPDRGRGERVLAGNLAEPLCFRKVLVFVKY